MWKEEQVNPFYKVAGTVMIVVIGAFVSAVFYTPHESPPETFFKALGMLTAFATLMAALGFLIGDNFSDH